MKDASLFLSDGFTINGIGYALRHSPSYLVLHGRRRWVRPLCFRCYVAIVMILTCWGIYKNAPAALFLCLTQFGVLAYHFLARKKKALPNLPGRAPVAVLKARIMRARASATSRSKSPPRRPASKSRRSSGRSSEETNTAHPPAQ